MTMANIRVVREGGETVDEIVWTAQELDIHERPNGPAVAAILAAGVGVFVLGLLTVLSEANTDVHDFLDIKNRVGPLSGKTTFAVVAYLVAWVVLLPALWRRSVPFGGAMLIAAGLIAAGFVGTFPKFFELFAE
jgi:hypothetical protein